MIKFLDHEEIFNLENSEDYENMSKNEIKENIESLKVCFDFLERF